ncbi:TPA: redoxin domain-containing protein [Candidatus Woesearchaeota archaeon]|nr:redoxin domain-containing protein [Candidatus Woesearchaeota archaeon]HII68633.1 redoxin domain-containing protein [Candidatus Woesearchaeota archaeon]
MMEKRAVILLVVVAAIIGSIAYLESLNQSNSIQPAQEPASAGAQQEQGVPPVQLSEADRERIAQKEKQYTLAPELAGIAGTFNADHGLTMRSQRGKIVLVDFWTYSCINCIRTMPYLKEWHGKYADNGLVIIGVHTPEFEFEKNADNLQDAITKYGIAYPVVQDNDMQTWRAYQNRYWPRKYLVDADGFIRYDHIGEGGYAETEEMIKKLLAERGENVSGVTIGEDKKKIAMPLTPELYAGYSFAIPRGQNIGNKGGLQKGTPDYAWPSDLVKNAFSLSGKWTSTPDSLIAAEDGARVFLPYAASQLHIVADSGGRLMRLKVLLDGKPLDESNAGSDVRIDGEQSSLIVTEPRLYTVVDAGYDSHTLELVAEQGFTFNSFTFG